MPSIDDIEREDEELADYAVGFHDRLDCAAYETVTEDEIFETKSTTVAQMWTRLEEVWRTKRNLGPGWSRGWRAAHEAQQAAGRI
jgi:hypothetical protein